MDNATTDPMLENEDKVNATVNEEEVFYAGFWMRLWAYLFDIVIIGSIQRLILHPLFLFLDIPLVKSHPFTFYAITTAVIFYAYFVLFTKFSGQTLGKMILGIKVYEINRDSMKWSTVLFREVIGRFISKTVLFLGFIVIAFQKKKQGWHDKIADTIVVVEKNR